jgi:hypothetical protein
VTGSALIGSDPDQEVVQEEATRDEILSGWTRIKLEPSRRKSRASFVAQSSPRVECTSTGADIIN